jgi:hypothetical protein
LKTIESQFSVTPAEEIEDVTSQSPLLSYGASAGGLQQNHTSKSANGSIITMTLKNNHLIVETEERGVGIERNKLKLITHFLFQFKLPVNVLSSMVEAKHYFLKLT